jgi:hypothetical protein
MPLSCPLFFHTLEPCARRGEPVTVGLPWPRGAVADDRLFQLIGPDGSPQVLQTRVLDRWPDGSVRWCLFDFLATWDGVTRESGYRVEMTDRPRASETFPVVGPPPFVLSAKFDLNRNDWPVAATEVVEEGSIRRRWELTETRVGPCRVFGHADTFPNSKTVRLQLTIQNPQPAAHPGGNWDLGNDGSFLFTWLYCSFVIAPSSSAVARLSAEANTEFIEYENHVEIHQESSGGPNWQSTNHVTRDRVVPLRYSGYEIEANKGHRTRGGRATPILTVQNESHFLGVAVPRFWENFPKRISAFDEVVFVELFPNKVHWDDLKENGSPYETPKHELQGGEQKTHAFYVAFGKDAITDDPMVWCRSPIVCHAAPTWYADSGAIPYLTPKAGDPHAKYLALVDQALDGPDTFVHKREKIDEYGWRNFGDVYGDHEAVYHKVETPLVSHYNNQYDCVAGFLWQFLRSGDVRWLAHGLECADHTCDIDIYHTDGDKAAYNRGLFWHTYHYADADTGTHRSYPKAITRGPVESLTTKMDALGATAASLKKTYQVGGGPASSNNYNHGLMLAYFLTGNPLYRDGALDLAGYVLGIEDPSKTPFRFLSREFTGLASESNPGYHGPGRGSANSINATLVGHQLTGDAKYLAKAEQIIRRVVHPRQNLERLDLLNAELRWYYTMTLQAVGRYLDYKADLGQLDETYAYARLAMLHYARWMAANERPILDTPEKLQYPTETWAAQDMRKVEVFQYAAKHAAGDERAKFLERAAWFFDYVQNKLSEFETKSLCRPVILMLTNGWSRNWWRLNPDATAPEPAVTKSPDDFGEWRMFVPQKAKAIKRAKMIVAVGGILAGGMFVVLLVYLFK